MPGPARKAWFQKSTVPVDPNSVRSTTGTRHEYLSGHANSTDSYAYLPHRARGPACGYATQRQN